MHDFIIDNLGKILIGGIAAMFGTFFVAIAFEPHAMGFHDYTWVGGQGEFHQDYGECRSQALIGYGVDYPTLDALMRARGYDAVCDDCGKSRWPVTPVVTTGY